MRFRLFAAFFLAILLFVPKLPGQRVELREAAPARLPAIVDSNSPALWVGGRLQVYTSAGEPKVSFADGPLGPFETTDVIIEGGPAPLWIESIWRDDDGIVFAWYHHEVLGVCHDSALTMPTIGALVSGDGGRSFRDLGIILYPGEPLNCQAENGYFAGGYGDFSVVYDRGSEYFYFFFGAYGGALDGQGVAAARMAYSDRYNPIGAVKKYFQGAWEETAFGGRVTPVFGASVGWERPDTDSFWGPSVHWNTHLNAWVMLLNRACCDPGWPQEGVYVTFNSDLSNPAGWKAPHKLFDRGGWYPQVIGLGLGETDSTAGQIVRLFVHGGSDLELVFHSEAGAGETGDPLAKTLSGGSSDPRHPLRR